MKLFIPTIGTFLRLDADLVFNLHHEFRNESLIVAQDIVPDYPHYRRSEVSVPVLTTLPAGTILCTDRIYIRQDAKEFDSVSFYIEACPDTRFAPVMPANGFARGRKRFWLKLDELNGADVTLCPDTTPGMKGPPLIVRQEIDLAWGEKKSYAVGDYIRVNGSVGRLGVGRVECQQSNGSYKIYFAVQDDGRSDVRCSQTSWAIDMRPATKEAFDKDVKKFIGMHKQRVKNVHKFISSYKKGESTYVVAQAIAEGYMTYVAVEKAFEAAGYSCPVKRPPAPGEW